MIHHRLTTATAALMLASLFFCQSALSDIVITQRESRGRNDLLAGSGGALQQNDVMDLNEDLTGAFVFSDSASVAVAETDPFSNGAAAANGSLTISDNVVQNSPSSITLTATRSAAGGAQHISGTGNANSSQRQTFRVRFQTGDSMVRYDLSGMFNPGDSNGQNNIRLHRPFTTEEFFDIDMSGPLSETGVLDANKTYQFVIISRDIMQATAGNPGPFSDASSFDVLFTLTAIPEPGTGLAWLAGLGGLALIRIRRR